MPAVVLKKIVQIEQIFKTEKAREEHLKTILFRLYDKGYLTASVEKLEVDSTLMTAHLTIGPDYKWAILKKGNVDDDALNSADYHRKVFTNTPFSYRKASALMQRILRYYENHGFPFASVKLDSISSEQNLITANLLVDKNMFVKIDSIVIIGDPKLASQYIYSYIGIKPGDYYKEAQVSRISNRIREIPFIAETKLPEVVFTEKYTKLVLYLERKGANQIDGVLGFLPDENTGKIQITGQAHPVLRNALGRGEIIDIDWRKLQQNTQDLKVKFNYPFLFSTPIGIDLNLRLFRKDTTFNEVYKNASLQYLLERGNFFRVFIENKTSSLISASGLENIATLPAYADVSSTLYGIGFRSEKLDYRLNPRRGYRLIVSAAAGNKKIEKNPKVNETVYNDLDLNAVQYSSELTMDFFIPILQRNVINLSNKAGFLHSSYMFQNELFRIGGLRTLRGFDEESIFASAYSISTLEYRYLLERNSYLFLFTDFGYYENKSVSFTGDRFDTPFGFGTGISFETKAGIFSINYALGKQFNNPIYFRAAKIHFGIISVL